jgi:hypothetical protein
VRCDATGATRPTTGYRIDYGESGGGCGFYNQSDVCARSSLGIGDAGQLRSVHGSRVDLRLIMSTRPSMIGVAQGLRLLLLLVGRE